MEALQMHGGLGAGYRIAMRDLEIRGAGNLLGTEQSGHVAVIGFELYCRLLRSAVARMQTVPYNPLTTATKTEVLSSGGRVMYKKKQRSATI